MSRCAVRFNGLVGRSEPLREVHDRVVLAAQTDATVLLRGETGTGKGRFARAIHVNSKRQAGPFVTVDCTTLPQQLVESELFGHERGAFTGADRRVPGKVEIAEGGTLFLDEIGDLPLDVQGKLLRFLQDRAYERVGGRQTLLSNVRVVCATHRELAKLVREGRFREDLYYRVRVVEIELPTLRASRRPGTSRSSRGTSRTCTRSATGDRRRSSSRRRWSACDAIHGRAMCASSSTGSRAPSCWRRTACCARENFPKDDGPVVNDGSLPVGLTLAEAERRYVERTLEACGGNKAEAARRLGIGRNTLGRLIKG